MNIDEVYRQYREVKQELDDAWKNVQALRDVRSELNQIILTHLREQDADETYAEGLRFRRIEEDREYDDGILAKLKDLTPPEGMRAAYDKARKEEIKIKYHHTYLKKLAKLGGDWKDIIDRGVLPPTYKLKVEVEKTA
jgi:hypothetical protein